MVADFTLPRAPWLIRRLRPWRGEMTAPLILTYISAAVAADLHKPSTPLLCLEHPFDHTNIFRRFVSSIYLVLPVEQTNSGVKRFLDINTAQNSTFDLRAFDG